MFFIRENDAENHWIDKDMPTDISIVDCIVVYTISRNKGKKMNRTERKSGCTTQWYTNNVLEGETNNSHM